MPGGIIPISGIIWRGFSFVSGEYISNKARVQASYNNDLHFDGLFNMAGVPKRYQIPKLLKMDDLATSL